MRFVQPLTYAGNYGDSSWPGYKFKESLGYTSGRHTGVDYNGPGAGNADLGMPVGAIALGEVVLSERRDDLGYGNTIIIKHTLPNGLRTELGTDFLYSRYMHLNTRGVSIGQMVGPGQRIGTCGNTGTQYAHLHLDLWKANLGVHMRYDKDSELQSYLDPFTFIEAHKTDTGGNEVFNNIEEVKEAYVQMRGVEGTLDEMQAWVGQSKQRWIKLSTAETSSTRQQLADARKALANEQNKPAKEVIKEVQVIVDRPVEVIKEVPVYTHDEQTKTNVEKILKIVTYIKAFLPNLYKALKKGKS